MVEQRTLQVRLPVLKVNHLALKEANNLYFEQIQFDYPENILHFFCDYMKREKNKIPQEAVIGNE